MLQFSCMAEILDGSGGRIIVDDWFRKKKEKTKWIASSTGRLMAGVVF